MKKKVNTYKIVKIAEFAVFILAEIAFLLVLLTNRTLKTSVFADRSLFTLCAIMYISVLLVLLVFLADFIAIKQLRKDVKELETIAFLDSKTGIPNRTSCNLLFDKYKTAASMKGIGCSVCEISNLKELNKKYGKEYGDKVIREFSKLLESSAKDIGFVGRNGGNEFISVIENCQHDTVKGFFASFSLALDAYNKKSDKDGIEFNYQYVLFDESSAETFSDLIAEAYAKLRK